MYYNNDSITRKPETFNDSRVQYYTIDYYAI